METLSGVILNVAHRSAGGFIVFQVKPDGTAPVEVVGTDVGLHSGDVVDCEGEWISRYNSYHRRNLTQFKTTRITPRIPSTPEAICDFFASGRIKGINKELGERLVRHFGVDLIEIAEHTPHRLKEVSGFGKKRIDALVQGLKDQIGFRGILIFLHGFGLSLTIVNKIYDVMGSTAVSKITECPYSLCDYGIGVSFKIADRLARKIGLPADDPKRVLYGLDHALSGLVNKTGNTGVDKESLFKEAFELLNEYGAVPFEDVVLALSALSDAGLVYLVDNSDTSSGIAVFPERLFKAEEGIASHLSRLVSKPVLRNIDRGVVEVAINGYETDLGFPLAPQQRDAIVMALQNNVAIITGGPGTGKTTIVKIILGLLEDLYGVDTDDVLICAPTGMAADRVGESSGREAMTIHRALGVDPVAGGFNHHEDNPLEHGVIVADEGSMLDTELSYSLLQAVKTGARVLMLGDADQIPSVGPGAVYSDLIKSGALPVTRLSVVYRRPEGGQINQYAHEINQGITPDVLSNPKNSDFWFIGRNSDDEIADEICSLFDRLPGHLKVDAFEGIQVLTPMRITSVGVNTLNSRLQDKLNKANEGRGIRLKLEGHDIEFRPGDKVMHIKNNASMGVFNGMSGRVHSADQGKRELKVNYSGFIVNYTFADLEHLRLGYAKTIHKSQGSEYPCVIIPFTMSHRRMLYRNLYYTGITRAKAALIGVGTVRALETAVSRGSLDDRLTGLIRHIKLALPSRMAG